LSNGSPASPVAPHLPAPGEAEAIARAVEVELAEQYRSEGRSPHSPEARRERSLRTAEAERERGIFRRSYARIAPGSRPFAIVRRVLVGTYFDGFIHAGNLAYLSLIALFPFFITATALMTAFGRTQDGVHLLEVIQSVVPPAVAQTLDAPVREVLAARTGPLLWLGGLVGLWTVGSLIETIRDILRRAYGTRSRKSFWHYRFYSILIIIGAVLLLLLSFSAQVMTLGVEQFAWRVLPPEVAGAVQVGVPRTISTLGLFLSLFLLFLSLTPADYRGSANPKWPGALFITLWWVGVTQALPPLLASMLAYDLTYGSLAGVMIVLFFFYLIGLGVVIGAELNAALADGNAAEQDRIGQADDREEGRAGV